VLAVDERHTQFGLQRLDALGERRLRDMQRNGSAPEMAMLDQGEQVLKASWRNHDNQNVILIFPKFIFQTSSKQVNYAASVDMQAHRLQ
jgi:hypothetical protein